MKISGRDSLDPYPAMSSLLITHKYQLGVAAVEQPTGQIPQLHTYVSMLSVAPFALQHHSGVTDREGPQSPKYLLSGPLPKKLLTPALEQQFQMDFSQLTLITDF